MRDVDVVNLALDTLGAERISNLLDPSRFGKAANLAFPVAANEVMKAHNWGFMFTRIRPDQALDENLTGFEYSYYLPADYVSMINFVDGQEYTIENGIVYTNVGPSADGSPIMTYISRAGVTTWPYEFCYLVALFMAYMMAAVVGMDEKTPLLRQRYQAALADTVARTDNVQKRDTTLWVDF